MGGRALASTGAGNTHILPKRLAGVEQNLWGSKNPFGAKGSNKPRSGVGKTQLGFEKLPVLTRGRTKTDWGLTIRGVEKTKKAEQTVSPHFGCARSSLAQNHPPQIPNASPIQNRSGFMGTLDGWLGNRAKKHRGFSLPDNPVKKHPE